MKCSFYCLRSIGLTTNSTEVRQMETITTHKTNAECVLLSFLFHLCVCIWFYRWLNVLHTSTNTLAANDSQRLFIVHCWSIDDSWVLVCSILAVPFPGKQAGTHTNNSPLFNIFTSTPTIPSHMTASKLLILFIRLSFRCIPISLSPSAWIPYFWFSQILLIQ